MGYISLRAHGTTENISDLIGASMAYIYDSVLAVALCVFAYAMIHRITCNQLALASRANTPERA